MTTHFIVHEPADTVGVVVVEDVQPGMELTGWIMETDETVILTARDTIPLGHKLALREMTEGETVIKYGHDIGRTVAPIGRGHHAHVHNVKTKRW